jgi:hypothetical protein
MDASRRAWGMSGSQSATWRAETNHATGGARGVPHAERDYLPLTAEVLAAHLSGQVHIGLYPLLDSDRPLAPSTSLAEARQMLDVAGLPKPLWNTGAMRRIRGRKGGRRSGRRASSWLIESTPPCERGTTKNATRYATRSPKLPSPPRHSARPVHRRRQHLSRWCRTRLRSAEGLRPPRPGIHPAAPRLLLLNQSQP